MFSRRELQAAALVGGLALTGFGIWRSQKKASQPAQGPLVVAVLPFANLSSDAGLDWVGSAAQQVTCLRAGSLRKVRMVAVRDAGEAAASGAIRLLHGSYTGSKEALAFRADVEDLPQREMLAQRLNVAPEPAMKALASATSISAAFSGGETPDPFPTQSLAALEAFSQQHFEDAVRADAAFSYAWRGLAEAAARSGDAATLKSVLGRGDAAESRFTALEKLRWDLLAGRLSRDRQRVAGAAASLAQAQPGNAAALAEAANAAVEARRLPEGIKFYQSALMLDKLRKEWWNSLGYAFAYQGEAAKAMEALRSYEALDPRDANPPDSMGDVMLRSGKFREAARFYEESYARQPKFVGGYSLYKAAVARRWEGETGVAEGLFKKYLNNLEGPAADLERADWLYFTGRPGEARAMLRSAAEKNPRLQPAVQRRLMLDDIAKAPAVPPVDLLQALWLTARGQYQQAEPLWRRIQTETPPAYDDLSREMLLKCLRALGKPEAEIFASVYPIPRAQGQVLDNPSVLALAVENRHK